jgi:hypothetical protein
MRRFGYPGRRSAGRLPLESPFRVPMIGRKRRSPQPNELSEFDLISAVVVRGYRRGDGSVLTLPQPWGETRTSFGWMLDRVNASPQNLQLDDYLSNAAELVVSRTVEVAVEVNR